ncbi:MAG: reverse transcriptase domain-containing protein [Eubacteriales bacterium]|nr:reverse transcriptase domain-containing protein [Eubacteriales bacterium]
MTFFTDIIKENLKKNLSYQDMCFICNKAIDEYNNKKIPLMNPLSPKEFLIKYYKSMPTQEEKEYILDVKIKHIRPQCISDLTEYFKKFFMNTKMYEEILFYLQYIITKEAIKLKINNYKNCKRSTQVMKQVQMEILYSEEIRALSVEHIYRNKMAAGIDDIASRRFSDKAKMMLSIDPREEKFTIGELKTFKKYDKSKNKEREYMLANVNVRVILKLYKWAIEPIINLINDENGFHKGKGYSIHDLIIKLKDNLNEWFDDGNKGLYIVKVDIQKFYPSIRHKFLKKYMPLPDKIIDVFLDSNLQMGNTINLYDHNAIKPYDENSNIKERLGDDEKGVDLGFSLSQDFAALALSGLQSEINIALNKLHKRRIPLGNIKPGTLYRFVDDIIVLAKNKEEALLILDTIEKFLFRDRGLLINEKKTKIIYFNKVGFDYCGFRFEYDQELNTVRLSISKDKVKQKKEEIKELLHSKRHDNNIHQILNTKLRGFYLFYRYTDSSYETFKEIDNFVTEEMLSFIFRRYYKNKGKKLRNKFKEDPTISKKVKIDENLRYRFFNKINLNDELIKLSELSCHPYQRMKEFQNYYFYKTYFDRLNAERAEIRKNFMKFL